MVQRDYRPRDYLPQDLHDEVYRIGRERQHNLSSLWHGTIASAATAAQIWLEAGRPGPCPLPPPITCTAAEVRWKQRHDEEAEQEGLIVAAGSTRTAVITALAELYAESGGHMITVMRGGQGRLPDLGALLRDCPAGCPLAAREHPSWCSRPAG